LIFYQYAGFNSLSRISVSYDFTSLNGDSKGTININQNIPNNYSLPSANESFPIQEGFNEFLEDFIEYIENSNTSQDINFTEIEDEAFENIDLLLEDYNTTLQQIESLFNSTIETLKSLYNAFLQGFLPLDFFLKFLKEIWLKLIELFIPEEWNSPIYIIITNGGDIQLRNVTFNGDFILNNQTGRFIHIENQIISSEETLKINFTLANMIKTIINIAIDEIVNITFKRLSMAPIGIMDNFTTYMHNFFTSLNLSTKFQFSVIIGLLPFTLDISVNLKQLLQNIDDPNGLDSL
jgi:hypothetical protein